MKLLPKIPILGFLIISLILFYKTVIYGSIPAPFDLIVSIYHPFRGVIDIPFKNTFLADVISIIIPWKELVINNLVKATPPIWNPYSGAGAPLAANFQSGAFYPYNIIFAILTNLFKTHGFLTAWNLYLFLIPFASALFTYLFLKQKKLDSVSSFLGAVIFSFGGYMIVWLEYGIIGHVALWLPLMFLSVDKINLGHYKYVIVLSLSVALSILAGYPQVFVYSFFFLISYIILNFQKKLILQILFSIFLGILLSGIQILPSVELLQNSIRGIDEGLGSKNFGYLPPQNIATAFFPDIFGNPATGNFKGTESYNDTAFYLGILPLALSLLALMQKKNREITFFLIVALFSLIISSVNPLSKFIYSTIPGLSGGVPGRALLLFDFSLSILAAYGFDSLFKQQKNSFKNFVFSFSIILLLIIFIWLSVYKVTANYFSVQDFGVAKRNLILPTAVFLSSSALILLFIKLKISHKIKSLIPVLIIMLVAFELIRQGIKYNSFSPPGYFYPKNEITDYLIKNAKYDRVLGTIPSNMNIVYRLYSPETYDAMILKRYSEFLGIINNKKPEAGSRYASILGEEYGWFANRLRDNYHLINLLGPKYIIFNYHAAKEEPDPYLIGFPTNKYKLVLQSNKNQIYENLFSLPRAFLVYDYKKETDKKKIAEELLSLGPNLRKKVILEEDIVYQKPDKVDDSTEATIEDYQATKIKILVNAPHDAILFLSDNYYPGWQAFIDGKETKIYRADYTFRAIVVPQGSHQVVFSYFPNSFKIGLLLSASSLILLVLYYKKFTFS